jgi:hypothetical protein
MLVLDLTEILPPLRKYKYDTWRILSMKCYIDNSVHLRSCIRNVNSIKDYNLLVVDNKSLASGHDELKSRSEGLQAELANPCSDAKKRVAALEVKVSLPKLTSLMLHLLARSISGSLRVGMFETRGIVRVVC